MVEIKIFDFLRDYFEINTEAIDAKIINEHLSTLDSLDMQDLKYRLEDLFDVNLDKLKNMNSVEDLVKKIEIELAQNKS
jgi:acyl carrier protein